VKVFDLLEEFDRNEAFDDRLRWLNPPPKWSIRDSALVVQTGAQTDFWQRTHYGFQADSGHFLFVDMADDFECTTEVRFSGVHQYDQAGLMVRVSPHCWLKTSVEYEPDGPLRLGAVVTNHGYSDWSTQNIERDVSRMWFRIVRSGPECTVLVRAAGADDWTQIRVARLLEDPAERSVSVGLYACSPTAAGYTAAFERLHIVRRQCP
jgi:hypothetical protein